MYKKNHETACLLLVSAAVLSACVNESYTIGEDSIDTEIELFKEGLAVPLGSTSDITLEQVIRKFKDGNIDFLEQNDEGYLISYGQSVDFSKEFNKNLATFSIDAFKCSEDIGIKLDGMDDSSISIPEMTIPKDGPYVLKMTEFMGAPEISDPTPLSYSSSATSGIYKVKPDLSSIPLPSETITTETALMTVSGSIPPALINDNPLKLTDKLANQFGIDIHSEVNDSHDVSLEITLPEGISSVNTILTDPSAAMIATIEIDNPIISSGTVIPNFTADLSQIVEFKDNKSGIIDFSSDLTISDKNGYKASKAYPISALAIDQSDWTHNDKGETVLKNRKRAVSLNGSLRIEDCTTTTRLLCQNEKMHATIKFEFVNFKAADADFTISDINTTIKGSQKISIPETKLPKEVDRVEKLVFGNNSRMTVSLTPHNLSRLDRLKLRLEDLQIDLPDGLTAIDPKSGLVVSTLKLDSPADINGPYSYSFQLAELKLPSSQASLIGFDSELNYSALVKAVGDVSSSQLPSDASEDVKFDVDIRGAFDIADYSIVTRDSKTDISEHFDSQTIRFELQKDFGETGVVAVIRPEGNPIVSIRIDYPKDILSNLTADNLTISFPEMLEIGEVPASYGYDKQQHCFRINGTIPNVLNIPVKSVTVSPKYDKESDSYIAEGEISISGNVMLGAHTLDKASVNSLLASELTVIITIPAITPAELSINDYSTSISKDVNLNFNLNLGENGSIVKEIETVNLTDCEVNISIDASSVAEIIKGDVSLSALMSIPKIIVTDDSRIDSDGVLHIDGKLKEGIIAVEPVKVKALNLSGIDMSEGINESIHIEGRINVKDADVDLVGLEDNLNIRLNANIGSKGSNEIIVKDISGKIDYSINEEKGSVDLSELKKWTDGDNLKMNLDFASYNLALDFTTNVNAPLGVELKFVPYYDGNADESKSEVLRLDVDALTTGTETSTIRKWISNSEKGMPAGYEYVNFNFLPMLCTAPDKIDFVVSAHTDASKTSSIALDRDAVVKANYKLTLPLKFGEQFEVCFRDTITALPDVITQALESGDFEIAGTIVNGLPLGFDLECNLLDDNDKVIRLAEGSLKQRLSSCNIDGSASTNELSLKAVKSEGMEIPHINSLEVVFKADSDKAAGVNVKADSFISGTFRAILPSGIRFNPNKK